ncbi:M12 family metallopeptidase [Streptomyces sp. FXJ1.172]|uniref:beta-glucuronidase AbsR1 n=1 Tax=Streptomyces sp. FXJ1.172 TaxID=710705 RepID=UPI0007CF8407|nr:M12 family metallopeptidase [Streptomyces sp. FXJ1.172]WEO94035.1 M12 family metallopeptidase [Streptomyces sp. FXJ1.172]
MTRRLCSLPRQPAPCFAPGLTAERLGALLAGRRMWVNGTVLHYYFYDDVRDASVIPVPGTGELRRVPWAGGEAQRDAVRECLREWRELGIGVTFREVGDRHEAELRIGFQTGGGSWSAVGREALTVGRGERTMNLGWDVTGPGERATVLHVVGHALGMVHEHQSPYAGLHWDDEAVYAELAGPPNFWSRQTTDTNVLQRLEAGEASGSVWDPQSVMTFAFGPGLVLEPEQYRGGLRPSGAPSPADKEFVLRWYPPAAPPEPAALVPFRSAPLGLGPGEQADFSVEPPETRDYTVGTFGDADTVLVVFEERDGEPRFLAGHDDGGAPGNAAVRVRLVKGRRYVVRVRLYSTWGSGETAVMCW